MPNPAAVAAARIWEQIEGVYDLRTIPEERDGMKAVIQKIIEEEFWGGPEKEPVPVGGPEERQQRLEARQEANTPWEPLHTNPGYDPPGGWG